jgi:osmotically-inducible protein OsmY
MKRIKELRGSTLIVAMILLATIAIMPSIARADKQTDKAMQTVIEKRLEDHGIKNVKVMVNDGGITLTGEVATIAEKMKAEKDAKKIGDKYGITNDIKIKPMKMSDQELLDKVVEMIKKNVFYSIYDWVTIRASNGVVTLSGWVYEPWHKPLFLHQVQKVAGVTEIKNDIQVLPVSLYDDQIRRTAARIIYDTDQFEPYSNIMNPPIHIIVNQGKVTLEGFVTSQYQRDLADNLITVDTNALQVMNNLQVVNK